MRLSNLICTRSSPKSPNPYPSVPCLSAKLPFGVRTRCGQQDFAIITPRCPARPVSPRKEFKIGTSRIYVFNERVGGLWFTAMLAHVSFKHRTNGQAPLLFGKHRTLDANE